MATLFKEYTRSTITLQELFFEGKDSNGDVAYAKSVKSNLNGGQAQSSTFKDLFYDSFKNELSFSYTLFSTFGGGASKEFDITLWVFSV